MLDIGWSEIALIAVVALVVIGPKDLPHVLKTIGVWVRKARMLTREFQSHVDDMIREAELDDVRKKALELKDMNLARQVENTIDPTGSLRTAFEVDPDKAETRPAKVAEPSAPAPAIPEAPQAPRLAEPAAAATDPTPVATTTPAATPAAETDRTP